MEAETVEHDEDTGLQIKGPREYPYQLLMAFCFTYLLACFGDNSWKILDMEFSATCFQ
jgi:hypothetical protein